MDNKTKHLLPVLNVLQRKWGQPPQEDSAPYKKMISVPHSAYEKKGFLEFLFYKSVMRN